MRNSQLCQWDLEIPLIPVDNLVPYERSAPDPCRDRREPIRRLGMMMTGHHMPKSSESTKRFTEGNETGTLPVSIPHNKPKLQEPT